MERAPAGCAGMKGDGAPRGARRPFRRYLAVVFAATAVLAGAVGLADLMSRERATAQAGGGTAQYFLRIDGIPGESTDAAHKDQIELASYEWGGGGKPGVEAAVRYELTTTSLSFIVR